MNSSAEEGNFLFFLTGSSPREEVRSIDIVMLGAVTMIWSQLPAANANSSNVAKSQERPLCPRITVEADHKLLPLNRPELRT